METATLALCVSSASLIVSAVTAAYNISGIRERRREAQLADEALWSFRVLDENVKATRFTEGSDPIREALISYRGVDEVAISLLTPLSTQGHLLPAIDFAAASERPSGLVPGTKTFSGCLLSVDIVPRSATRKQKHHAQEFWFFIEVPIRPAAGSAYTTSFVVLATFEEVVASRRVRQIRLKSDTIAWAMATTTKPT